LSLSFQNPKDLENMITKVLRLGLEGLVLKDLMVSAELGWTVACYTWCLAPENEPSVQMSLCDLVSHSVT
jgi:ABC-type uncharacterized transport system YnjBCD permease subunit